MNMANKTKLVVALVMSAISNASFAEVSGSVTLTSDYIFDGISQTQNDPALQAGVQYDHESGLYAGAWGSNVDFGGAANLETDWYAGYSTGNESLMWDVGFVQYVYLDDLSSPPSDEDADYYELYVGMTIEDNFTVKYWYADDYSNLDVHGNRVKLSYAVAINEQWSVPLEYTYTDIDGDSYNHARVGIAASMDPVTVDLSFHQTDLDVAQGDDPDLVSADGLVVATATFEF